MILHGRNSKTYVVAVQLLLLVKLTLVLVDTRSETVRITTERNVQVLQKSVAAGEKGFRLVGMSIDGRLAVEHNNTVSEISSHDEIVLDNESGLLRVHDETLDDSGSSDTLCNENISM